MEKRRAKKTQKSNDFRKKTLDFRKTSQKNIYITMRKRRAKKKNAKIQRLQEENFRKTPQKNIYFVELLVKQG